MTTSESSGFPQKYTSKVISADGNPSKVSKGVWNDAWKGAKRLRYSAVASRQKGNLAVSLEPLPVTMKNVRAGDAHVRRAATERS